MNNWVGNNCSTLLFNHRCIPSLHRVICLQNHPTPLLRYFVARLFTVFTPFVLRLSLSLLVQVWHFANSCKAARSARVVYYIARERERSLLECFSLSLHMCEVLTLAKTFSMIHTRDRQTRQCITLRFAPLDAYIECVFCTGIYLWCLQILG